MAKYRVMQMTLTATHNGSAELTVVGSKLDGIEYASFKCTDKNTIMLVLDMYMDNPNDERVSTFEGEYVDVPTPYGDTARVFARYSRDELGNKVYYPGCSPHELMCEYVAGINRACQDQAW